MSRMPHGTRRAATALLIFSLLLCSCNNAAPARGRFNDPAALAQPAGQRMEVSDNFDSADLERHFEDVGKRLAPSVVAISATDAHVEADDALRSDSINPEKLAAMLEPVDRTVGTGFVVDPDGYIVTNDHVVASNDKIWVTTDDHHVYPAIVIGTDPRADLAVLKIPANRLKTVRFCDTAPRRGQWTLALGNPYGLAGGGEMSLSVGVVSATGRSLPKLSTKEDRLYCDLIQTTAQINPGNSGGPLFNLQGEVIGINAAVILPQKQTNGIGFAIPVTTHIRQVIADLKAGREVTYSWIGVHATTPTPQECKDAGLGSEIGAKIESIDAGAPAETSKLQAGDIVTRFDGQSVNDSDDFARIIGETPVSRTVHAEIFRQGQKSTVELKTARRQSPPAAVTRDSQRFRWRGMLLGPIPQHWDFPLTQRPASGLMVIAIDPASPFIKQGVTQGSIIAAVGGKAVSDVVELQRIINDNPPADCGISLAQQPKQVVSIEE